MITEIFYEMEKSRSNNLCLKCLQDGSHFLKLAFYPLFSIEKTLFITERNERL